MDTKLTEFGDAVITPQISLHNVLYIPSFRYNLMSVHSLALSLRCIVFFTNALCLLQAPSVKRPQVIGNSKDGLYFLCSRCLKNGDSVNVGSVDPICCFHSTDSSSFVPEKNKKHVSFVTKSCCVNKSDLFISNKNRSHVIHGFTPVICTTFSDKNSLLDYDSCMNITNIVDLLWHNRLGHVPFVKMRNIPNLPAKFS